MGFPPAPKQHLVLEPWKQISKQNQTTKKTPKTCAPSSVLQPTAGFSPLLASIEKGLRSAACSPGRQSVTLLDLCTRSVTLLDLCTRSVALLDLCMNWKTSMGKHEIRTPPR